MGLGDVKFRHRFDEIPLPTREHAIDISTGFQHSLVLTGKVIIKILKADECIVAVEPTTVNISQINPPTLISIRI